MHESIEKLNKWLEEMDSKHPADWDMLPDIGLYMDQVQTYIDKQLTLYRRDEKDRLLTPAMINNYIKDDLIPRAVSKKYSPTHLALLIMIGTLKQVLSMQNLSRLLSDCRDPQDAAELYSRFKDIQRNSLSESALQAKKETRSLLEDIPADDESALRGLALQLSIEARTRILIAEKILVLLDQPDDLENMDKAERKSVKKADKKIEKNR